MTVPGVAQQPGMGGETPTLDTADGIITVTGITRLGYANAVNWLSDSLTQMYPVVNGHAVVRHDSVMTIVDKWTRTWNAALARGGAPHRIELFSAAMLHLRTGHDVAAQRCLAAWLATPGLTEQDHAWILSKSIELFLGLLSPHHPKDPLPSQEHLAIAHQYLAQLEAMPRTVSALSLFGIYRESMELYLSFGMVDTAIVYGRRAFALPAQTADYQARLAMVTDGGALTTFSLALSAYPDRYHPTIDSLITMLRGYVMAPIPPAYAQYPWNMRDVTARQRGFDATVMLIQTLGRPAPALIATQWFNQPTPTMRSDAAPNARVKPLNDGIVRLIGFGHFGCMYCQMAMKEWQQFQHDLPTGTELLFVEQSEGYWGGELIEPEEEAERLRHYYVERKRYTFPIAVWAGPKVANTEGGRVPIGCPTIQQFGFQGLPSFVVIDGNGILRYRSEWSPRELLRVLIQLTRERRPGTVSASASSPGGSSRSSLVAAAISRQLAVSRPEFP